MATKRSWETTADTYSTVLQLDVMETQRETIKDRDINGVLGISSENDEEDDEDEDEDEDGSDIEELDDDDLDDDDSDEDESDED